MIKKIIFLIIILVAGYSYLTHLIQTGKFDNFLDKYPNKIITPHIEYYLGRYYIFLGKPEKAIHRFKRLLKNFPQSTLVPKAQYSLGLAYEEQGNISKAKEEYQIMIKKYPNHPYSTIAEKKLNGFHF